MEQVKPLLINHLNILSMKNLYKMLFSLFLLGFFCISTFSQSVKDEIEKLATEPTLRKNLPNLRIKIDTIRHTQGYSGIDGTTYYQYSDYIVNIFNNF